MESPRSLREKVEGMGVGQEGMATSTEQEATTPRPTVVEGDAKRGKGSWRVGGGGAWKRRVALAVKAHGVLRAGAFA